MGANGSSSNGTENKIQVKSIKSMNKVIFTGLTQQRGPVILKICLGNWDQAFPTGFTRTHKVFWNPRTGEDSKDLLNTKVLSLGIWGLWKLLSLFTGELVQMAKRGDRTGLYDILKEK